MVLELTGREPVRLGNATIDPVSRDARWPGGEERLQPQTLKVLIVLAAKRGEVVTRDELAELCWDGRIVGEDVINRSVSLARHVAARAGGFSIETVPRAGYRLIEHPISQKRRRRRFIAAGAAAISVVTVVAAVTMTHPTASPTSPTLHVLVQHFGFDAGDDASRKLAAEVEESSVRMLTGSEVSVEIADGVGSLKSKPDFVLTGSVAGSGAHAVASIRLADAARHAILMSGQIPAERSDPGALPDQVGARVAIQVSAAASFVRLDHFHPSDPAVLANALNTGPTSLDSQRVFQRARQFAKTEPDSALAQYALAQWAGVNVDLVPTAERAEIVAVGQEASERALRLAPNFGNAYAAWCLLHAEVRIAECEARLRRGLLTDPQSATTGTLLSHLLQNAGRNEEAVSIATEGLAKQPFGPTKMEYLLIALQTTGRTRQADELFKRGERLWPGYWGLFESQVSGMVAGGNWAAIAALEKRLAMETPPPDYEPMTPIAHAVTSHSLPHLRTLCPEGSGTGRAIACMLALARLGDLDASFKFADRLFPRRTARTPVAEDALWVSDLSVVDMLWLTGPSGAPLREDRRFIPLADRLGLLRYWRSNGLPDFCTRAHELVCVKIAGEARNG